MFSKKNLEERRFWRSFLAVYKQYPEIWDPRCEKYSKREFKEVAYQALALKLKEIDPYASTDCVKRRLNIFKSNYKRELRRRKKTGTKGNLWYFDDLNFLVDIDKSRTKKSETLFKSDSSDFDLSDVTSQIPVKNENMDLVQPMLDNSCMSNFSQSIPHSFQQERNEYGGSTQNMNINEQPQLEPSNTGFPEDPSVFQSVEPKISINEQPPQDDSEDSSVDEKYHTIEQPEEKPKPQGDLHQMTTDDADVYSKSWATTFRKIPANQQQLAKKLIDDILYEGYMGRLAEGKVQFVT